jgi:hypothetical protein
VVRRVRIRERLEILRRFPGFDELYRLSHLRPDEGFRVNLILRRWLNNCQRRIDRRLDKADLRGCDRPMLTAANIHYETSGRARHSSLMPTAFLGVRERNSLAG